MSCEKRCQNSPRIVAARPPLPFAGDSKVAISVLIAFLLSSACITLGLRV